MSGDPATFRSLAARAEAGEWSREDDAKLAELLGAKVHTDREWHVVGSFGDTSYSALAPILHYNESLDAQEAVGPRIEVVLWMPCLKPDTYRAETGGRHDHGTICVGEATTEPLARLAAKLRALAAEAERGA